VSRPDRSSRGGARLARRDENGHCVPTRRLRDVGTVTGLGTGVNAALGMTVGRVGGMGAGYIYSKNKQASE